MHQEPEDEELNDEEDPIEDSFSQSRSSSLSPRSPLTRTPVKRKVPSFPVEIPPRKVARSSISKPTPPKSKPISKSPKKASRNSKVDDGDFQ